MDGAIATTMTMTNYDDDDDDENDDDDVEPRLYCKLSGFPNEGFE